MRVARERRAAEIVGLRAQPLARAVDEALGTIGVHAIGARDVLELVLLDTLDPALHLIGDRAQRLLEALGLVFVFHAGDDRSET